MLKLSGYWRSSAAYRVRIALNLKGLEYEYLSVHLVRDGGEQHKAEFRRLNPQGLVPVLQDGALTLQQSPAILEYLEEAYPEPAILPGDVQGRARVRSLAALVACDIHPLNNLRVLNYLGAKFAADPAQRDGWIRHWISLGFAAFESLLADSPATGSFCHGETPGLADLCLVPQVYNARRFDCDLQPYPNLCRIEAACLSLAAFADAQPERQPDAT